MILPGISVSSRLAHRVNWRRRLKYLHRFFMEVRPAEYVQSRLRDDRTRSQRSLLRRARLDPRTQQTSDFGRWREIAYLDLDTSRQWADNKNRLHRAYATRSH